MCYYLMVKMGEIFWIDEVYEVFKFYVCSQSVVEKGVDWLVEDIYIYVEYYCVMVLGKESDKLFVMVFQDLCELKVDVVYFFLLVFYYDYKNGDLFYEDFLSIICLIEFYVFCCVVCVILMNFLNKIFVIFYKVINKENYLESIQVYFLNLFLYCCFFNDDEFKWELKVCDFYNFCSCSYWL